MKNFQIGKLDVYKTKALENKRFFNGLYHCESKDVFEIDIIERYKNFVMVAFNMKNYFFNLFSDN